MTDSQDGTWAASTFLKAWEDYVSACQVMLERFENPGGGAAPTSLPVFGAWQEFAKSLGMNPGFANGAGLKPEDMMAHAAPALGLSREWQSTLQRMADLGAQFQHCYTEFLQQSAGINEQALKAVQERITAEPALTASPAAAYEAWIDSAEAAYAQTAHSEAFARSLGELCNLLSAFKAERAKLLEAFAKSLDLPSRAEVDSLHRQMRELRARAIDEAPDAITPFKTVDK